MSVSRREFLLGASALLLTPASAWAREDDDSLWKQSRKPYKPDVPQEYFKKRALSDNRSYLRLALRDDEVTVAIDEKTGEPLIDGYTVPVKPYANAENPIFEEWLLAEPTTKDRLRDVKVVYIVNTLEEARLCRKILNRLNKLDDGAEKIEVLQQLDKIAKSSTKTNIEAYRALFEEIEVSSQQAIDQRTQEGETTDATQLPVEISNDAWQRFNDRIAQIQRRTGFDTKWIQPPSPTP